MKLNELRNRPGATHSRKVLGRGIGSGLGKTSGRGVKGQKARTGVAIKGFEGGQMPLFRRLPKRGFSAFNQHKFVEINIGKLQAAVDAGRLDAAKPVTVAALMDAGILRHSFDGLRVLGDGELKAKLTIEATYATKTAQAAIEKAGGSVKIITLPGADPHKARGKTADGKKIEKKKAAPKKGAEKAARATKKKSAKGKKA
ncbi:MAG: 50S ribosomal protein L15 [Rhodospirillaceae bacterium]|nr:50S ribosomal protein L15 [Rhodospirillaceae bacterium]